MTILFILSTKRSKVKFLYQSCCSLPDETIFDIANVKNFFLTNPAAAVTLNNSDGKGLYIVDEIKTLETVSGCQSQVVTLPIYIWKSFPQDAVPKHKHDFMELVLVCKGSAKHWCDGKLSVVQEGELFIIPQGVFHEYVSCSPDFSIYNILYQPEILPLPHWDADLLPGFTMLLSGKFPENYPHFQLSETEVQLAAVIAEELYVENRDRQIGYQFRMLGLFITFIGNVARKLSRHVRYGRDNYLNMEKVISFINRHFRETITVSALCRIASMSRPSLQRSFRLVTGTTPVQYQLHLRISEAVHLLSSTDLPLNEIALQIGFMDVNYFSRQFKKINHISPALFRQQKQKLK